MENTKVTKRDMYEAIIETMKTGECAYPAEDVVAFCENEIELLDKKAVKAKERAAAKHAEGDALADLVASALTSDYQVIADITAAVADKDPDATVSKVTYRLSQLVKAGVAEKQEVTISGGEGTKARKVQAYRACQD
jgi:hypothetical protein